MRTLIGLDFETADRRSDSACAIGLAKVVDGVLCDSFYHLIRPPRKRMEFTWLHGISLADVEHSPVFADLWQDIMDFCAGADALVAHNAGFDRRVLQQCCLFAGLPQPAIPFLCTLKGSRKILPLPSHKLSVICEHLHIPLNHHHAGSDATAAVLVYLELCNKGLKPGDMLLR